MAKTHGKSRAPLSEMRTASEERTEDYHDEIPTIASVAIESIRYDVQQWGECTETVPCQGLQALLSSSCATHGGVVGVVETESDTMPAVIGYLPIQERRDGHLLAFNYCPCCGKGLGVKETVLGVTGVTMLQ